jgi:drug/metabolite transporter (DMT)-like permease
MPLWIPVTLAAAAFQTSRTALQHRLRSLLSVSGAGFVRYVYGAPLSLSAIGLVWAFGVHVPMPPGRFWPTIVGAGIAQILGTIFLIRAFEARDFAVGTVYAKTEVVQVAVFSAVFLGEPLRTGGWVAGLVCLSGVGLLVARGRPLTKEMLWDKAALLGVLSGACMGLASIGIRASSKSLASGNVVVKALLTLAVMNSAQATVHGAYLAIREPGQITKTVVHWRSSAIVGVLSVFGSACWALAMSMENAAKVRTFGQVELLFTFLVSHLWFKEKHVRMEFLACGLVLLGVVGVMVAG